MAIKMGTRRFRHRWIRHRWIRHRGIRPLGGFAIGGFAIGGFAISGGGGGIDYTPLDLLIIAILDCGICSELAIYIGSHYTNYLLLRQIIFSCTPSEFSKL